MPVNKPVETNTAKLLKKKTKQNRVKINLLEKDAKMLKRFCKINKISQATALKKIIREYLTEHLTSYAEEVAKNQLGLFDSVQTNIFDEIKKKRTK